MNTAKPILLIVFVQLSFLVLEIRDVGLSISGLCFCGLFFQLLGYMVNVNLNVFVLKSFVFHLRHSRIKMLLLFVNFTPL